MKKKVMKKKVMKKKVMKKKVKKKVKNNTNLNVIYIYVFNNMNSVYLFLKLAILAFYPDNTKISLDDTTITFRPPSMSQGVWRWVYGESRNDILRIKEHILNMIYFFRNSKFKSGDSIMSCVCKALNKLKLCYIRSQEIKEILNMLELKLIGYCNNQGICTDSIIPNVIQNKRNTQILGKWTINDIQFVNYNIKCILELQKIKKSQYKNTLIKTYIQTIDEYSEMINSKN
jgi:hypothetical protein